MVQAGKAQHAADVGGWTRFASMQNHYNLVYREEEREMISGQAATRWPAMYTDADFDVVGVVRTVAGEHDRSSAQVALAWLLGKPGVVAPVLGCARRTRRPAG